MTTPPAPPPAAQTCPDCSGSGIGGTRRHGPDPKQWEALRCERCDGEGRIAPPAAQTREPLLPSTLARSKAKIRHGHTSRLHGRRETPTYTSWQAMRARCRYEARDKGNKYVNRGIDMDPRWRSFDAFLADMGERPKGTTLDRMDNSKGYWPDNCRWSTPQEQARNTRASKLTITTATLAAFRLLCGEKASAIAKDLGISESLPREIVRGRCWPDALARAKAAVEIIKP